MTESEAGGTAGLVVLVAVLAFGISQCVHHKAMADLWRDQAKECQRDVLQCYGRTLPDGGAP